MRITKNIGFSLRLTSLLVLPMVATLFAAPAFSLDLDFPFKHICNKLPLTAKQWREGGYCDLAMAKTGSSTGGGGTVLVVASIPDVVEEEEACGEDKERIGYHRWSKPDGEPTLSARTVQGPPEGMPSFAPRMSFLGGSPRSKFK